MKFRLVYTEVHPNRTTPEEVRRSQQIIAIEKDYYTSIYKRSTMFGSLSVFYK